VYKLYDSRYFEATDQGIDTFFNIWRSVPLDISHYHKESELVTNTERLAKPPKCLNL
jgi:hypothetical protein